MAFNRSQLRGTGVAIVTPFHKNGSIDFKSLGKLVEHLIKGKVEYVVVLGTTGESVVLTKEEKVAVLNFILEKVNGRIGVVLGIGGNSTHEVVHAFDQFHLKGVTAILSVSPYYNKPTQQGIYEHYKAVSEASPLPIILYNVPGRTSSNMLSDTTLRIAEDFKNVVAIKEASANLEQMMRIYKYKPKDFMLISGDDALTLPIISIGGEGVISVVANAFPKGFSDMVRKALAGDYKEAQKLHYKHTDIIEQLFADGNPGGIKAALEAMGICEANLRLPLVRVNKKVQSAIEQLVKSYK